MPPRACCWVIDPVGGATLPLVAQPAIASAAIQPKTPAKRECLYRECLYIDRINLISSEARARLAGVWLVLMPRAKGPLRSLAR